MTKNTHNDIKKIVDAINITSTFEYTINGMPRDISKIKIIDPNNSGNFTHVENDENNIAENFKKVLTTDIYNVLYNPSDSVIKVDTSDYNDFLLLLSRANNGTGTWEEGWMIAGEEQNTGKVIVTKGSVNFWADKTGVMPENSSFAIGTHCMVKIEKDVRNLNTSFYMAFGNASKKDVPGYSNQLARFYWNLTPKAALLYMKLITESLNKEHIHFRTKVIADFSKYDRADAGVLYLDKSQLVKAFPWIIKVYRDLYSLLKPNVPMFSKYISKGLGFAEDPGDGTSFGISRSKLMANLLYQCYVSDIKKKNLILNAVASSFEKEGINPEFPYSSQKRLAEYEKIFDSFSIFCTKQQSGGRMRIDLN
jgi:hypothetical protein